MTSRKITLATKRLSKSYMIFSNSTSQQDCIDYKEINFVLADEKDFTLIVPTKSCAEGHHLNLYIFDNDKHLRKLKKMPSDKSTLQCHVINGNISHYEKITDDHAEITLTITDKVNDFWDSYIEQIEQRQENVSTIFDRYRK
ncbi:hypothetical protein [Bacteriovorax sp. DB6_IX]|uniref:hypothetical protein n=1 Tax=Bacteriovorax sp. DB6_IX TaxID=1353530 RepID=UPI0012FC80B6|nr:hypothetical protein [Bacteriovorax sp. DB6_IX]